MKVTGVIDTITSKTVSNGGTVFSAIIDGTEVNLGFNNPYSEGEYVELEVEQTKWGLQVPRKPRGGTAAGSKAAPKTGVDSGQRQAPRTQFPVDPNTKDHSIIRQNALTNANTAVANACKYDSDGINSREEYYNEVIKVAYNLAGFAMGSLDRALVEQNAKAQAAAALEEEDA